MTKATAGPSQRSRNAGAEIIIGTWTPILKIFTQSWSMGKFDESRKLENGKMMEYLKVYSLDAAFDKPEDVPARDAKKISATKMPQAIRSLKSQQKSLKSMAKSTSWSIPLLTVLK